MEKKGSSIGQVRGLGSAHEGTHHWTLQRYTAAGNLITVGYLVFSFLLLDNLSYETVSGWLSGLGPALALSLLVVSVFWHARLGLQVMLEDYVHERGNRFAAVLLLNLAWFAGTAFGLLCILRLAVGAGA